MLPAAQPAALLLLLVLLLLLLVLQPAGRQTINKCIRAVHNHPKSHPKPSDNM